jgi:hypothetical protein
MTLIDELNYWLQVIGDRLGPERPFSATVKDVVAALSAPPSVADVQTLLDLLNPLHGSLDRQTMNDKRHEPAPDAEFDVTVTAQQEQDLTQAILILEAANRRNKCPSEPSS